MEHLEELERQLVVLRRQYEQLGSEVRCLEREIIKERWKDIKICEHDYYGIRSGECAFAETYHGNVYCKNPNCGK